ncbi:MAG: hypothetical protein M1333_03455 [Patescibacteria group bacterium]|nr:hypothetical protein [Patescibacteria group bacterium]
MIKKILSFGFLSLCFGLVFLTQPKTADAACSYNITRMDSQSSVTSTGSLNINYAVKRSGTSGDCQNTPRFNFYAHASYDQFVSAGEGGTMVHFDTIDLKQITAQFNGDTAQGSFSYSLSGFPWCNLSNKNRLSLFMRVYDGGPVATSGDWNVNVTGTTCTQGGTGGAKTLTLNFDRASYNKGDYIDVFATLSNTSGAKDVEMVTYVGSQVVGSFQVSAAALSTPQKQRVTVGTGTGFVDGTNTIKVAMYEAGSNRNLLYAQGTASVQAAGLGTTAGTGGGTGGTGTGGTGGTGGGTGGTGTGGTGGTGGGTGGGAGTGDTLINPLPIDN